MSFAGYWGRIPIWNYHHRINAGKGNNSKPKKKNHILTFALPPPSSWFDDCTWKRWAPNCTCLCLIRVIEEARIILVLQFSLVVKFPAYEDPSCLCSCSANKCQRFNYVTLLHSVSCVWKWLIWFYGVTDLVLYIADARLQDETCRNVLCDIML